MGFVVRSEYADTGTIMDLKGFEGRKFSIGKKNSGTEGSGRTILGNLGINPDNFNLGYGPSADAMQNGAIDGMNIPSGVPTSAITRAYAAKCEKKKQNGNRGIKKNEKKNK